MGRVASITDEPRRRAVGCAGVMDRVFATSRFQVDPDKVGPDIHVAIGAPACTVVGEGQLEWKPSA